MPIPPSAEPSAHYRRPTPAAHGYYPQTMPAPHADDPGPPAYGSEITEVPIPASPSTQIRGQQLSTPPVRVLSFRTLGGSNSKPNIAVTDALTGIALYYVEKNFTLSYHDGRPTRESISGVPDVVLRTCDNKYGAYVAGTAAGGSKAQTFRLLYNEPVVDKNSQGVKLNRTSTFRYRFVMDLDRRSRQEAVVWEGTGHYFKAFVSNYHRETVKIRDWRLVEWKSKTVLAAFVSAPGYRDGRRATNKSKGGEGNDERLGVWAGQNLGELQILSEAVAGAERIVVLSVVCGILGEEMVEPVSTTKRLWNWAFHHEHDLSPRFGDNGVRDPGGLFGSKSKWLQSGAL